MPIPFDLTLDPKSATSGTIAHLASDQLDPVLHPTGQIRVHFESEAAKTHDATFLIESLQIHSLTSYLQNQPAIRHIAETELTEARTNWLRGRHTPQAGLWSDTHFHELWLPCRTRNKFDGGTPQTASMYILVFEVQWDPEHVTRTLKFRDDHFLSLGIDGD